ncbi:MAG: GHKL domain-containing protein [Planctomycetes bacterium]|nr:GHKL domain-containing protein [Planctomycetota bacterium]
MQTDGEGEKRLAWLGTLAGGLAHEIKNPLSTMAINLSLLHEDFARSEVTRDKRALRKIEVLQREVKRLERILADFLAYARGVELDRQPTDLAEKLSELLEFLEPELRAGRIVVHTHFEAGLPTALVDRNRLRQACLNLIVNARQAMPEGGELVVVTRRQGPRAVIEIIDNGCGMDEATRARCFDAYFSTKKGGSGLGLPTVRRIAEEHDGEVWVESEPQRGTRFVLSLPLALGD